MEDPAVVTVMMMLSLFSICGTIGNSLVLYIYSHKKEKSTAGIFIMSLAETDLFTCVLVMPFTEAVVYLNYMVRYDVVCKIYMFFITCNVPFAAFIMVAIAIDRYFCICHPFLHLLNIFRAKVIVVCLLLVASTFGVITSLSYGVYSYEQIVPTNKTLASLSETMMYNESENYGQNVTFIAVGHRVCANCSKELLGKLHVYNNKTEVHAGYDLLYTGLCAPSYILTGPQFLNIYQRVYAGTYLLSFVIVFVLYGLIYRSIYKHRAKRSKRKRSSLYPSGVSHVTNLDQPCIEFSNVETQFTAVTHVNPHIGRRRDLNLENGENDDFDVETNVELQPMRPKPRKGPRAISIKEKTLLANIRTAVMLFVVTVVFLIAFLPAWLMGLQAMEFNAVIFYMYFVYHTANPFIYAFMNKSFRDDLGKVLKCQSIPLVR
ncbi:CCKAR-like protein [Mya arenaria]|uniref:CCKAR-like protein n=1 Tax=Mya arenaria TaxID=6604 RepID=A0ABY7EYS3_MYAAR|nr:cholecystokinin receptor-like isoform X1 [Mya arenaria]XP_052761072.1 cholecystokinin receptor-like isoform X1 [Mya arenaria]WAR15045.1 CCKAR-like protein [Mya arenaria]WAR15093.1 CCKAR-like protein [Mya arenaria]